MTGSNRATTIPAFGVALGLALGLVLTGCGQPAPSRADQGGDARETQDARGDAREDQRDERPAARSLQDLIADPKRFDGREVTVTAAYYGSFERTVLVTALTRSHPPQPAGTEVWVDAEPSGPCLQRDDKARGVRWAHQVRASGTFRHDPKVDPKNPTPGRGFGHLGAYAMTIESATLSCP